MLSASPAEKMEMFRVISEKLSYTKCVPEDLSGTHIFLSLGSNLGERKAYLENALELLQKNDFILLNVSSIYETAPVGCEDGAGTFYNIAVEGTWRKDPYSLLSLCQKIEQELGRPADHAHWVSRVVDIDIILFGGEKINSPALTVPHPLALQRLFVMQPLAGIAPDLIFPGTGRKICDICKDLAGI